MKKAQTFKLGKSSVVVFPVSAWEIIRARVDMLEEYYQMSTSNKYKQDIIRARASKKEISSKDLYKKLGLAWVMKYDFKGNSIKEFSKLPRKVQLHIKQKLEFYMSAPSPLDFAERLTDFELGEYRFRVGDYRVAFDVENDTAKILKVGHRKDVYR